MPVTEDKIKLGILSPVIILLTTPIYVIMTKSTGLSLISDLNGTLKHISTYGLCLLPLWIYGSLLGTFHSNYYTVIMGNKF